MVELKPEVKKQISDYVITWKDFEVVLEIFKAVLVPEFVDQTNPKLSLLDGMSFDKMCKKISDLLSKFKIEDNDSEITDKDRNSLLKILKEYKGKKSPDKLAATSEVISFLNNSNKEEVTYKKVFDKISKDLLCYFGKSKECSIWDEINKIVEKCDGDDLILGNSFSVLSAYYRSQREKISKNKRKILDEVVDIVEQNAERNDKEWNQYESHKENIKDIYEGVLNLKNNLKLKIDEFIALVKNRWEQSDFKNFEKDEEHTKAMAGQVPRIYKDLKDTIRVKSDWMKMITKLDKRLEEDSGKLCVSKEYVAGISSDSSGEKIVKIADWEWIAENFLGKMYVSAFADADKYVERFKNAYKCELEGANGFVKAQKNFEETLGIYAMNFKNTRSKAVQLILNYLLDGWSILTESVEFCKLCFPNVIIDSENHLQRLRESVVGNLDSKKYDIHDIITLIDKLNFTEDL